MTAPYQIEPLNLDSVELALERLGRILRDIPEWQVLSRFLPATGAAPLARRAQIAATFGASLELVKSGQVQVRQDRPFGPLYVRSGRESVHA